MRTFPHNGHASGNTGHLYAVLSAMIQVSIGRGRD